jgi:hypothetical protein
LGHERKDIRNSLDASRKYQRFRRSYRWKWFQGTAAPATGTGAIGDWFVNTSTFDIYEKTAATTWTSRGNIKGAAGAAGAKWLQGTTAPASGTGAIGDWFINTATFDIYEKTTATVWTGRGNIKGASGAPGAIWSGAVAAAAITNLTTGLNKTALNSGEMFIFVTTGSVNNPQVKIDTAIAYNYCDAAGNQIALLAGMHLVAYYNTKLYELAGPMTTWGGVSRIV